MALDDYQEERDEGLGLADVIAALARQGPAVPTTLPFIDRYLRRGGLTPGKLVTITGPPGSHKTMLACQMLNLLAPAHPGRGLFVDEGREEAAVRLGQQLGYKQDDLEAGGVGLIKFIQERMEGTFLLDDPDAPGASIQRSALRLRAQINGHGAVGILAVDSVQTARLTSAQEEDPDERTAIRAASFGFRLLCRKEPRIIGILTAQANREQYKSKKEADRGHPLAGAAGSRAPEYASDLCIFMGLPDDDDVQTCWITKNRMGKKGKFFLKLDRVTASLTEIDSKVVEERVSEERREQILAGVAAACPEILEELARAPGLSSRQIYESVGGRKAVLLAALKHLEKEGRISSHRLPGGHKTKVYDLVK